MLLKRYGRIYDMLTKDHISKRSKASEIKMEIDTEGEQMNEPIVDVIDENIRQDNVYEELMTVDEGEDILFTVEDSYNFDVSVAVTDLQADEVDAEFTDAIQEIDGTKNFPCSHCEKVCKSKGGLTRHTRSKHLEDKQVLGTRAALCKETVASIVETIKAKLKKENLYGSEVTDNLATVSPTDALFDALH